MTRLTYKKTKVLFEQKSNMTNIMASYNKDQKYTPKGPHKLQPLSLIKNKVIWIFVVELLLFTHSHVWIDRWTDTQIHQFIPPEMLYMYGESQLFKINQFTDIFTQKFGPNIQLLMQNWLLTTIALVMKYTPLNHVP